MSTVLLPRAVIDTNVVFEGLTKQGGASALIIDAWLAQLFRPCVSNSLAYEYVDVLSRKLSKTRWQKIKPVLGTLFDQAEFITIYYSWRPASPDPGDDHVVDCAMNAGAPVVTWNARNFRLARQVLGLEMMTPVEFVTQLANTPS